MLRVAVILSVITVLVVNAGTVSNDDALVKSAFAGVLQGIIELSSQMANLAINSGARLRVYRRAS